MPGFDTYTQLRQAEDVQDEIYNISPIDNPICAMSRTIMATGKIHEWTQDQLRQARKNAQVEGATAGADVSDPVIELQNYCQIMDKVAEITGTLEAVDKYGRDSEMAYQLEMRYGELANEEEVAVAGNPLNADLTAQEGRQVATPGDGSTGREMASIYSQLDASVKVDAAAATDTGDVEAFMIQAHLATYLAGGNPRYAVTDPLTAGYFPSFALSAGRNRDIESRELINVIDLYVSQYGELDVVLDRNMLQNDGTGGGAVQGANAILLLDFMYLATPVLRATDDWALAKQGDSDRRQVLRESTFAVLNTKAHALVDNVPTGLAPA